MAAAPFPLTLALSLGEREQHPLRSVKPKCLGCSPRWIEFTLSPGERAGRGKKPPKRKRDVERPAATNAAPAALLENSGKAGGLK